jgi:mono/diheme cytochrome c family protein
MEAKNHSIRFTGLIAVAALALMVFGAGCTPSSSGTATTNPPTTTIPPTTLPPTTTTSPSTTTPPPTTGPPTTTSSATTFQSLAASGQTVYSGNCALCHGAGGGGSDLGPPLWGTGATLGTYNGATLFANNAQAMFSFISAAMPLTAPGSLTQDQYLDVLAYILIQGNQVSPSTPFAQSQLSSINLK